MGALHTTLYVNVVVFFFFARNDSIKRSRSNGSLGDTSFIKYEQFYVNSKMSGAALLYFGFLC